MMKKLLFMGLFLITASLSAQESVNNYKYIIVPKKFEFLKEPNQYRVNTYTKFLFKKNGYTAIYDDEQPQDLRANPCLGLKANVLDNSNLFTTKMNITLENCRGDIVFTSDEGKSKIKEYEDAYQEAIENAFVSVRGLNYHYEPMENTTVMMPEGQNPNPTTTAVVGTTAVAVNEAANNVAQEQTSQVVETPELATAATVENDATVLYAQPIANGYQLVDSTPKVVYKLTKTTQPNYFIIQGKNGFVYKKDGKWIAEYYEGEKLKQEILNIKF